MGICWYCYWGWAKPVAEIYLATVEKLGGNDMGIFWGPSHTVWANENWDYAEESLRRFNDHEWENNTKKELEIIRWSLEELVKIPLKDREIEPEDYDDEHPARYPPAKGVEVMRV